MNLSSKSVTRSTRFVGKVAASGALLSLGVLCGLSSRAQGPGQAGRAPLQVQQPVANVPLASDQLPALIPGQTAIPGDILVGVADGSDDRAVASHFQQLGQTTGYSAHLHAFRVRLNAGITDALALEWLRHQAGIAYAENNHRVQITATPNDASYSAQWALPKIQADQAWANWVPQGQVVLAIVDTGVDFNHPDLTNVMFKDTAGNVIGHDSTGSGSFLDGLGHGTHCAGIAAAQINNGTSFVNPVNNTAYGIAGVAGWNGDATRSDTAHIKIMPVRVLDSSGSGSDVEVADGIEWAADHGAKVISMSLGGPEDPANPGPPALLNAAVQYAWGKGVLIVAAAGNSNSSGNFYPAACPNVVSVAATDTTDTLASFSNYGNWVKVAAPGVNIFSTLPTYATGSGWGTFYNFLSGTSMATPHVAGEAAMLFAQKVGLTNQQVHDTIISSVNPINGTKTLSGGAGGRVNFLTAINAIGKLSSSTQIPSAPTGLTATPGNAQITLGWSATLLALTYNVKRGTSLSGPFTTIATMQSATTYTDGGTNSDGSNKLVNGTTYYYVVTAMNAAGESSNSNTASATSPPTASGTVKFVKADASTSGTWKGVYGSNGYNIINNAVSYPTYASVAPTGQTGFTWAASTPDTRALQQSAGTSRIAACWYSPTTFTVDVNLTDGLAHQVSFYCLDWDKNGRQEKVEMLDAATNAVLDTQSVSGFGSGVYLVYTLTGHVKVRLTFQSAPIKSNAVLSGIFFD
jgi:thermitase